MMQELSSQSSAQWWRRLKGARPRIAPLALFYFGYVLAGGLGQGHAVIPGVTITFWPPAGIFAAILLVSRRAAWPWWILAACLAELTCNAIWFHNPIVFALIYFSANALEALAAALLLRRVSPPPFRLNSLREVLAFFVLGAGIAPTVGATIIAVTDHLLGKHHFAVAWPLVWLGDASGLLIMAPVSLVAIEAWQRRERVAAARIGEAAALILALMFVGAFAFTNLDLTAYMTLPALLWIAVRFRLKGAAAALGILTLMTTAYATRGLGEFSSAPDSTAEPIVMLQTFLAISAISALLVAALSTRHQETLADLEAANRELEHRVSERTRDAADKERQLASVLEALPLGVALVDAKGRVTVSNDAFNRFAPDVAPSRDRRGRDVWEAFGEDGQRIPADEFPAARALRGAKVWPGVEFLYHGDASGRPLWTRVASTPVFDGAKRIVGAATVIDDIDSEKRAQDALKASEERYGQIMRQSPAGIAELDANGRLMLVNERLCQMLGYSADELKEMTALEVTDEGSRAATEEALARLAAGGSDIQLEKNYKRKDGTLLPAESNVSAIRRPDGSVKGFVAVVVDNTERKRTAEALEKSERRYRNAFESASTALFEEDYSDLVNFIENLRADGVVDLDAYFANKPELLRRAASMIKVKDANRHCMAMLEASKKEDLLQGVAVTFLEETYPVFLAELKALMAGAPNFQAEARIQTLAGKLLDVIVSIDFPKDHRQFDRVMVNLTDITERKRQERHREILVHELNHRVKNTLAMVQGIASQTLSNAGDLNAAREAFTARLMSLARAHDVLTKENWDSAALHDVVDRAIAAYRDQDADPFAVEGPPARVSPRFALALSMILHELCTNAVKYGALSTPQGRVSLSWSVAPDTAGPILILWWRESGGPRVAKPRKKGFGTRLMERALVADMGEGLELDFNEKGLVCKITSQLSPS